MLIDDALTPAQVRMLTPGAGRSVVLVTEAGRLGGLRARGTATFVDISPMAADAARLLLARIAGEQRITAEPDEVRRLIEICDGSTTALCVVGSMLAEFPDRPLARLGRELADEQRRLAALSRDSDLSVTAVLNTAYARRGAAARRCYAVFGGHPGGGDLSVGVLAAALGESVDAAREAVDELISARLVRETPAGRYLMSDLVRLHARHVVASDDPILDLGLAGERIVTYYWARAWAADRDLMPHRGWRELLWPALDVDVDALAGQDAWEWLESERGNLRAIVDLAYGLGDLVRVCQFGVALWPLYALGKYIDDVGAISGRGVDAAGHLGDPAVESVLRSQWGFTFRDRGQLAEAFDVFSQARDVARRCSRPEFEATAVESMGLARLDQGDIPAAHELLMDNLGLARSIGTPRRVAMALFHLAKAEPVDEALRHLAEARHGFESLPTPDRFNIAKVLTWQGKKLTEAGRWPAASAALTEALTSMTDQGKHFDRAQILDVLAEVALGRGEPDQARRYLSEAIAVYRSRGFPAQAGRTEHRLAELG